MELHELTALIRAENPDSLASRFLNSRSIHACSPRDYVSFCRLVKDTFTDVESVKIAGSGNWRYSLDPYSPFREFNNNSDIDTVIISRSLFSQAWEELRNYHRSKWYALGCNQKEKLKRNGQNVYSGFVSPKWILEKANSYRFEFIRASNRLSNSFGGREVNILFFRNIEETVDYYKRGIVIAKRGLNKNGV